MMNKHFNVFIFLLIFVFTIPIESSPHEDFFKKRNGPVGKLLQCPGDFPITFDSYEYTPIVLSPGKNFTENYKWTSTIEIVKGSIATLNVYHKNDLLYSHKEDFCAEVEKLGGKCPIPPGTYHTVSTHPFDTSPDQPKDVTDEYLVDYVCKLF